MNSVDLEAYLFAYAYLAHCRYAIETLKETKTSSKLLYLPMK